VQAVTVNLDAAVPAVEAITILQGADFTFTITCVDAAGAPVAVTAPQMQIRKRQYVGSRLILGAPDIVLTVVGNVITVQIAGSVSAAVYDGAAAYDLYADRIVSGSTQRIAQGQVVFSPTTTDITSQDAALIVIDLGNGYSAVSGTDGTLLSNGYTSVVGPGASSLSNGYSTLVNAT